MRKISSSISAAVLVVFLSTTVIATPAFAMPREGGPRRDDPIVRVVKQILKKLGITPNEEPAVPHP